MNDKDPEFDFKTWLEAELKRMYEEALTMFYAYEMHEWLFGVPCGPTLSMTNPNLAGYHMCRDINKPNPYVGDYER